MSTTPMCQLATRARALSVSVSLLFCGDSLSPMTQFVRHEHMFQDVGMRVVKGRPIQYIRCHDCGLLLRKR
jgi:hypothetical protein